MNTQNLASRVRWRLLHPYAIFLRVCGMLYRLTRDEEPWISSRAIAFCEKHLNSDMEGLEWGSGRSTVWFAARLKKLTSVEHDSKWYEIVHSKIDQLKVSNLDYRWIELDHPKEQPTLSHYECLPKYVSIVHEFKDQSIDFVVVDGHYRQSCILQVIPKLKSGGLLLVDNTNWMKLKDWGVPSDWPVVHQSFGFDGETTIWKKP